MSDLSVHNVSDLPSFRHLDSVTGYMVSWVERPLFHFKLYDPQSFCYFTATNADLPESRTVAFVQRKDGYCGPNVDNFVSFAAHCEILGEVSSDTVIRVLRSRCSKFQLTSIIEESRKEFSICCVRRDATGATMLRGFGLGTYDLVNVTPVVADETDPEVERFSVLARTASGLARINFAWNLFVENGNDPRVARGPFDIPQGLDANEELYLCKLRSSFGEARSRSYQAKVEQLMMLRNELGYSLEDILRLDNKRSAGLASVVLKQRGLELGTSAIQGLARRLQLVTHSMTDIIGAQTST